MEKTFIENVSIERVVTAQAAGTTTITSSVVDMAEYDRICFVASLGAVVDSAVGTLQVFGSDASNGDSPVTFTGAVATCTTGDSDKNMAVEISATNYRYIFCTMARATANIEVDGITAYKTGAIKKPVSTTALAGATVKAY